MLVLSNENIPVNLNLIPDQVDLHFWVYDNSTAAKDYFCVPLIMLESFYSPTIRLRLTENSGNRNPAHWFVNVPADYQILIGEPTHGDLEINPVTSISGRYFKAFVMNPISSFKSNFYNIEVEDVLPSTKWFLPKMKQGQLLCVTITPFSRSECIYLVRDMPKSLEVVKARDAI